MRNNKPSIEKIVGQKRKYVIHKWRDAQYTPTGASRIVPLGGLADGYIPPSEREHIVFMIPDKKHPPVYRLISDSEKRESVDLQEVLQCTPDNRLLDTYYVDKSGLILCYLSLEDKALLREARVAYNRVTARNFKSAQQTDDLLYKEKLRLYPSRYIRVRMIGDFQLWHDMGPERANIVASNDRYVSALVIEDGERKEKVIYYLKDEKQMAKFVKYCC